MINISKTAILMVDTQADKYRHDGFNNRRKNPMAAERLPQAMTDKYLDNAGIRLRGTVHRR